MRFERESWRKLYVAESMQHRLLPVLSRGLRDYLLRYASEDGTLLARTDSPAQDLAKALGSHPDETDMVAQFAEGWLADGYLSHKRGRLFITRYAEAQEARSPGASRQAKYRDSKRVTSDVTGDATVTSPGDARDTSQKTRRDETRNEETEPPVVPPTGDGHPREAKPKTQRKAPKTSWPADFDEQIRPAVVAWASGEKYPDWWVADRLAQMKLDCASKGITYSNWKSGAIGWLNREDKTYGNGPDALQARRERGIKPPGAVLHEQQRADESRRRPELQLFKPRAEPAETVSAAEFDAVLKPRARP